MNLYTILFNPKKHRTGCRRDLCLESSLPAREVNLRRRDREITDSGEILAILEKADVCRIAMCIDNIPYLVTMNFGLKRDEKVILYFHCAQEGKKIDILKRNNLVCFEADTDHELISHSTDCGCSMRYRSVVGMGRVSFVTGREERYEALQAIMKHYKRETSPLFKEEVFNRTAILRLDVEEISGKKRT